MITSIVLIRAQKSRIAETMQELAAMDGVSEAYSVTGQYDLVAIVRVPDLMNLSDFVTQRMLKCEGIIETNTLLAFRAYSKYELEHIFT
ncbi:Lrp/AsnC ligand binding domain-containing protein [Oscillatoria sp. FACHB-1407]|uniref:Lrp/AsnC family transcriptional regulator n=1 Tax=Oscillatoria sp. FACHB-1407 TaxID=2692847 RepID=UPI0016827DA8|nr:Lrp/AsnC ligand binding domain-containing protein [Oscillatoria sp. FACHB-1407]MBD2465758.1 Lrp/AsnC ligand binding domain-containing protein [Oscillatoria sp. FACHB-1407]